MGTTHCKVGAYDSDGQLLHLVRERTPVNELRPGWAEYDPLMLMRIAGDALTEVTTALGKESHRIKGIGVAGMAEAGLLIDESGEPLTPIYSWYDERAAAFVAKWGRGARADELFRTTGLLPSFKCPLIRLEWLKTHQSEVYEQAWKWLHVPDYIVWRLTGETGTDFSLASRTLAFDIHRGVWCEWIVSTADINGDLFPRVVAGTTAVGEVTADAADRTGVPKGIPVIVGGHDHVCGAAGVGALQEGAVVDSMGTAESMIAVRDRLLLSQMKKEGYGYGRHVIPGKQYILGGFSGSGASVEWWMDRLGAPSGSTRYDWLLRLLEKAPSGPSGLLYLPYLRGSAPPNKDREARAVLAGITENLDPATWMKGIIEGLACEFRRTLDDMVPLNADILNASDARTRGAGPVSVIGGGTRNPFWMQLKADVSNRPLIVPDVPEAVTQGAAILSGVAAGVYKDAPEGASAMLGNERIIEPNPQSVSVYGRWYEEVYLPAVYHTTDIQRRMKEFGTR